jgi:hypothetical protein
MHNMLGEEGTEQFIVEVHVDGRLIKTQPVHDPFIHNTTIVGISRWDHFLAIFKPRAIKVQVSVQGTEGAQRAVMTMDPYALQRETSEILEERRISREAWSRSRGYCSDSSIMQAANGGQGQGTCSPLAGERRFALNKWDTGSNESNGARSGSRC